MFIGVSVAGYESVLVINCLSHLNLNPLSISNWKLVTSHLLKMIQLRNIPRVRRTVLKLNNKEMLHNRMDSLSGEGIECIKYN